MSNGRTSHPNINDVTMLVDSGATAHFLDDEPAVLVDSDATEHLLGDELIPGLKDHMMNPTLRQVPQDVNKEATVAATERQRAQIQRRQLQRPRYRFQQDK